MIFNNLLRAFVLFQIYVNAGKIQPRMHHGHLDLQKPPVEDSYIKAYHEQHQNDHLDQFRAPKMVKITQPTQAKPTKTKKVASINPTQIQFVKTQIPTPTSFIEKQAVSKDYKVYDQESQSSNEFQYGLEKLPSAPSQYFRVAYPHNVNEIKSSLTEILKKSPNLQLHEFQELFTKPIEEYHSDVANIQHKPNIVQVAHIQPEAQLQQQRDHHNALLQQELAKYLARQQEEKVLQQHQENLKHIFVPNVAPKEVNVIYQQHHSEVLRKPEHVEIPVPQTYQHLEVKESPLRHPKYLEEPSSLGEESDRYAAKYAFGYRVHDAHSGSDYGHEEHRDGDTTKGHYHVLLPDGRLQNVNYEAGPHGYNAVVTYH